MAQEITIDKDLPEAATESPQEKLKRFLATHKVKIARTPEELYGPKTGQTQEEIQAEVDDFLRMREEWRRESRERDFDL